MNNAWLKYGLNFILIVLVQGLVVNPWEIHEFLNPMVYPMLILMLPFELSVFATLVIAFALGICVDGVSNTFGLHASAAMVVGYLRPTILKYIKPRDGYDSTLMPSIHDMGVVWFMGYTTFFLFIHHLWFFTLEIFNLDVLLILAKTLSSLLFSLVLIVLLQFILYKASKK
jgi:rod shape-determining protein MreD